MTLGYQLVTSCYELPNIQCKARGKMELCTLHQYADHLSAWKQKCRGRTLGIKPLKCNALLWTQICKVIDLALLNTICEEGAHHFSFLSYLSPLPSGGCHRLGLTVSTVLISLLRQHLFLKQSTAWLVCCKCTGLSALGCRIWGFQNRNNPARRCLCLRMKLLSWSRT